MFRTGLLALLAATALSSAAFAADAVTVRSSNRNSFNRMAFEWPSDVPYHVTQEKPGTLKITFDRPATLDTHELKTGGGSNLTSMRQLSAGGAPLALEVTIPADSKFRDFSAGGKVIVDVYDPPGKKTVAAPVSAPAQEANKTEPPKPAPAPKTEPPKPAPVKTAPKAEAPKTESAKTQPAKAEPAKAESAKAEPPKPKPVEIEPSKNEAVRAAEMRLGLIPGHGQAAAPDAAHPPAAQAPASAPVIKAPPPAMPAPTLPASMAATAEAPDVISLSASETIGAAAFTRDGWLWFVTDHSAIPVPPKVTGPDADKLKLEKVDAPSASVWKMKLPDGVPDAKIYGEGGGLIWKIVLSPETRPRHEVNVKRPEKAEDKQTLVWPLRGVTRVIDVPDTVEGDHIQVATVTSADQYAGAPYQYVDLETLPSMVGMAVLPHYDDVSVRKTNAGVEVSRPKGLILSSPTDITRRTMQMEGQTPGASADGTATADGTQPVKRSVDRFFDLQRWMMGGPEALTTNQTLLLSGLKAKDTNARVQDLLTLAKMNLANDRGPESLGFLTFAYEELPAIADSPEYIAMRGAAEAIGGKYELALADLANPALQGYRELDYWRAYTLAWLEDWQQAAAAMPDDVGVLMGYPQPLLEKMAPKLAELALRNGDSVKANLLLGALRKNKAGMHLWTAAAVDYLQGQADLQKKDTEGAVKLWAPLVTGEDDFFRVRAGLALTMVELQNKKIEPKQAIDRLESLRYGWRGDELEAQINYMLGKLYIQQKQYLKGFTILRDASGMSPDADIAKEINTYMASAFLDILMNAKDISPVDAMNLYQQFHELAPAGDEGNKLVQKLADRLASTDLLGRAGDLLQSQVDYSLQGKEKADVAMRLAAIGLLNKDPQRTFGALDKAAEFYKTMPEGPDREKLLHAVGLMRARAVAQQGKTEEALGMLAKMGPAADVSRLRTDIAWQAGMWPDAADALKDLMTDENVDAGKALNDYQANLILNRAVALNLGGDRVELASMRQKYSDLMKPTKRGSMFEVVTRPHSINVMSEQQTLQGMVGEVDMFKDFLNDYTSVTDKGTLNTTAAPVAAAPAAAPEEKAHEEKAPAPAEKE